MVIAAIGGLGPWLLCVAVVAVLNDAMLPAAHKPSAFFHSNPLRYAVLLAGALLVSFVSESRRRSEEKLRGIDEALLPRIFDPFFSTKDETGTGIGLWVTKELVEKNDGARSSGDRVSYP